MALTPPADKRCKGECLSAILGQVSGSDEDLAVALGYYSTNEKGEKVALVDEFIKAKSECKPSERNTNPEAPMLDIYKQRLCMSDDDRGGYVFVPKRLVEANKEFYKDTELVDVTVENLAEVMCFSEEEAEEYIEMGEYEEPFMVQSVLNMQYINSWDLQPAEYFTYEEIAEYWDLRYEDCDLTKSSWCDG